MRRALGVGVVLFAFAVCSVLAQQPSVSFVDGDAQVRSGSQWVELSIGDCLSPQATIQLSDGAYIELMWAGSKIVLGQKGTYLLRGMLGSSRVLDSAGARKALSTTLSILLMGPARNQSTTADARRANGGKAEESEWVTSSAQVFLDSGKQCLKSGQNKEAIEQFLLALDAATEKESPEVQYNLAFAYSLGGDTRRALKHAVGLPPSSTNEWATAFIILKAKLFVDSSAYAQKIAWLTQNGNNLSGDTQRVARFNFPLGYRGVGDTSNEKASLSKVVAISGESDLGKAATQLLQNP